MNPIKMRYSQDNKILLFARDYEHNIESLIAQICWLGGMPIVVTLNDLRNSFATTIIKDGNDTTLIGSVSGKRKDFNIREIRSVWSRGFPVEEMPEIATAQNLTYHQWKYYIGYIITQLSGAVWMNSLDAIASTNNRLTQLKVATLCGFKVPDSLVTNRRRDVEEFIAEYGEIIVKQISSGHPRECADRLLFARKIDCANLAIYSSNIASSPSLYQSLVDKEIELRVYFVDGEVYCAGMRISGGDDVDSRSLISKKHYFKFSLDETTISKIRQLTSAMNLRYAAIDMAIDRRGDLVFFEVNHSGQWGYVERETGIPVTQSIASKVVAYAKA
ncbi:MULTISPECIES: hypothetical protein [Xanthomonas translucens group]|nr:hypothetical protein [Xanthomonas translucens]